MSWGGAKLVPKAADQRFYRICGVSGSGKTHLTKLFICEVLKELRENPHAKLIVYEPKREFFAWLKSIEAGVPVRYFMPSDLRSYSLDFTRDYPSTVDSTTLAHAFYPHVAGEEKNRFWGDALRTIYAGVCDAIKNKVGYLDLRVVCLVLEDDSLTQAVLGYDPYLVQARKLLENHGDATNETGDNIRITIASRIAEMKVIAAHLDQAARTVGSFSLTDFLNGTDQGVLAVSKDEMYGVVQDPMNAVVFSRLIAILGGMQPHPLRKVFIVIDEFPTLAGDEPCPAVRDMFLRLRSRGVVILITYQAHETLKRVYGEFASEIVGQCNNVIYLQQGDVESAEYASNDLGWERGYEDSPLSWSYGQTATFSTHPQWFDRPIFTATDLNKLPPANPDTGIMGVVKSSELKEQMKPGEKRKLEYPPQQRRPERFVYPAKDIDGIPGRDARIPEYECRDPRLDEDFASYLESINRTQRLRKLSEKERDALIRPIAPLVEGGMSWETMMRLVDNDS